MGRFCSLKDALKFIITFEAFDLVKVDVSVATLDEFTDEIVHVSKLLLWQKILREHPVKVHSRFLTVFFCTGLTSHNCYREVASSMLALTYLFVILI